MSLSLILAALPFNQNTWRNCQKTGMRRSVSRFVQTADPRAERKTPLAREKYVAFMTTIIDTMPSRSKHSGYFCLVNIVACSNNKASTELFHVSVLFMEEFFIK
jgi:hypothetical protein